MTHTASRLREFRLPDMNEGITEAEIVRWYVRPGDTVVDGQIVCEIDTLKFAAELPIPFNGVVHELRCAEGETVAVGTVVITVADADAAAPPPAPQSRSNYSPSRMPEPADSKNSASRGASPKRKYATPRRQVGTPLGMTPSISVTDRLP
ncbi:biotin-dependent enzyme [Streptomyces sp. Ag109_O5-1]|uniref:biotin/lipoyl-containing protein n=1 Tax=Streptomyces sp. Ag109_O5-1 TaxID=1938851 RepID=UPI000F4E2AF1|nr:biotin-dependent enzyme [Streptomyces sp. Ag109_O5-1]